MLRSQYHETIYSWHQLFSRDLTQLRSLDVDPGKMRQLAHMQLLFHPTQLTQLVLTQVPLDQQSCEVIVANLTQLRRLALIKCGGPEIVPTLLRWPNLPDLEQLGMTNFKKMGDKVKNEKAQLMLKRVRPTVHARFAKFSWTLPAGFVGHSPLSVVGQSAIAPVQHGQLTWSYS
jgi:hypothetical protein